MILIDFVSKIKIAFLSETESAPQKNSHRLSHDFDRFCFKNQNCVSI